MRSTSRLDPIPSGASTSILAQGRSAAGNALAQEFRSQPICQRKSEPVLEAAILATAKVGEFALPGRFVGTQSTLVQRYAPIALLPAVQGISRVIDTVPESAVVVILAAGF